MINKFVLAAAKNVKVISMLLLFSFMGCAMEEYNVILVIDAKDYCPQMTWKEIRDNSDKKPYNLRVMDMDGHAIRLYRFMHESRSIMPLDETEVHISTPIIIEKKYETFWMSVLDQGKEVRNVRVLVRDLKAVKGGRKAYVRPVELPVAHP